MMENQDLKHNTSMSIEAVFNILKSNQPDTVFAKRVWQGLATTFYQYATLSPYSSDVNRLNEILILSKQYEIEVPDPKMIQIPNLFNLLNETDINNIEKYIDYEFSATGSDESSEII